MKLKALALAAALPFAAANAAEVAVYCPYSADGFTVSAPSGTRHFDASFTGRRAVVSLPDPTNAVIEAWTGSAAYSVGSALYGTSAGRGYPSLDLSRLSPLMPRLNLVSSATDRAKTIDGYAQMLRGFVYDMDLVDEARQYMLGQLEWLNTNRWTEASLDASSLEQTRVRIVRWAVDGQPVYRIGVPGDGEFEVVFDKKMYLGNRAFLTEADILSTGGFDLDWDKLKSDVVDYFGVQDAGCPVTNVAYLVVIGDGKTYWTSENDTNSCPVVINRVVERKFSFRRTVPTPVLASFDGEYAQFKFQVDEGAAAPYDPETSSYTAFQVAVRESGATADAWKSGLKRLPAKLPGAKTYTFTTDDAALAAAVKGGKSYNWRCAVYNAKFPDDKYYTNMDSDATADCTNVWSSATLTLE